MNITELLELQDKYANLHSGISQPEQCDIIHKHAQSKGIMEVKLREIVDMLPEIKQLLIWCMDTDAQEDMLKMQEKIVEWENK